jgi:ABC-type transport system involved in multi-copper enzyme maturation permease subunit
MIGEWFGRIDRLQKSRGFMIIATIVLVLLGIGAFVTIWVNQPQGDAVNPLAIGLNPDLKVNGPEGVTQEDYDRMKSEVERFNKSLEAFTGAQGDLTSVAVGIFAATGVLVAAVWLGIGMSILGLALVAALIVWPMSLSPVTKEWGRLLGGILSLTVAFTVIMRGASLLLSLPGAMFAVAKNVIAEATRLKLSVLFIGVLMFALAALPSLLDPETPLRYRVQSFLQYATGGTFWIVALLIVLFSVSTVATEQRDKVIWQTMTKPIAAWQYILGKWIGIVTLAAALLTVSGLGTFLFVEFLRNQPAHGESGPFKAVNGGMSEDRQWLESQILTARVMVENENFNLAERDPQEFAAILDNYLEELKKTNAAFDTQDPRNRADVAISLIKQMETVYRQIEPIPTGKEFTFKGLETARDRNLPLIFRFRVDSGANSPDKVFKITFGIENFGFFVKDAPLGQYQTHILPPTVIRDDGTVVMSIFNGALYGDGSTGRVNPETVTFPKSGLILSYSVGSYRVNFVRVMVALWVKLAFLAMAGIFAGTFLSFPVATLVSFGIFLMAEWSTSITKALEVFDDRDNQNQIVLWKWIVVRVAEATSGAFKAYGDLQPTQRLVDGLLLSWSEVATGLTFLALFTVVLFGLATAIFRKRELAMYSGQ